MAIIPQFFFFKKKNKEVGDWDLELFKWREVTNPGLVHPVSSNSLFCLVFYMSPIQVPGGPIQGVKLEYFMRQNRVSLSFPRPLGKRQLHD